MNDPPNQPTGLSLSRGSLLEEVQSVGEGRRCSGTDCCPPPFLSPPPLKCRTVSLVHLDSFFLRLFGRLSFMRSVPRTIKRGLGSPKPDPLAAKISPPMCFSAAVKGTGGGRRSCSGTLIPKQRRTPPSGSTGTVGHAAGLGNVKGIAA